MARHYSFFLIKRNLSPESRWETKPKSEICEEHSVSSKLIYHAWLPAKDTHAHDTSFERFGGLSEEVYSQISLFLGLIDFITLFDKNAICKVIRTKEWKVHLHCCKIDDPEKAAWLILARPGRLLKGACIDGDFASHSEGKNLLANFVRTFSLLHGDIDKEFLSKKKFSDLSVLLEDFTTAYFHACGKLGRGLFGVGHPFEQAKLYSPLERQSFCRLMVWESQLRESFPWIKRILCIFNGHSIFSSLPQKDADVLYAYVCGGFGGRFSITKLSNPPFGRFPTAACNPGGGASSFGRAHQLSNMHGESGATVLSGAGKTLD